MAHYVVPKIEYECGIVSLFSNLFKSISANAEHIHYEQTDFDVSSKAKLNTYQWHDQLTVNRSL